MRYRYVVWMLVLLVCATNAFAQCGTQDNPCTDNWDHFDYDNPDADITSVPPNELDMTQALAAGRGKELKSNQLQPHLSRIPDLTTDVDRNEAIHAIRQEYGATVDLGNGAHIDGDVLSATYGSMDSIDMRQVSSGSLVTIDDNGNILLIGETSRLPDKGTYRAVFDDTTALMSPDGKPMSVSGTVGVTDTKTHTITGEPATVNGVTLDLAQDSTLYFDGERHEGSYVSLGSKTIIFNNIAYRDTSDAIGIIFTPDNPYIPMDATDVFAIVPEHNDYTSLSSTENELPYLEINARTNKPPLMTMQGMTLEDGTAYPVNIMIQNGQLSTSFSGGFLDAIDLDRLFSDGTDTSVPLEIMLTGYNTEGTTELIPAKIVYSDDNEVSAVKLDTSVSADGSYDCTDCAYSTFSKANRVTDPEFGVEYIGAPASEQQKLHDIISEMPGPMQEALKGKRIIDYPSLDIRVLGGDTIRVSSLDNVVSLYGDFHVDTPTMVHETAHVAHFNDITAAYEQGARSPEITAAYEYLTRDDPICIGSFATCNKLQFDALQQVNDPFTTRWIDTAGGRDAYHASAETIVLTENGRQVWEDGADYLEPRQGFIRAYGKQDPLEDIATYVDSVFEPEKRAILKEYIKTNTVARRKVELLREYGKITQEQYDSLF